MSSYLYLGQIKKGIDRGLLLNQALQRVQDTPNKDRKAKVLSGMEVAEVVDIMDLTDTVKSLFLLNRSLYEGDPSQGKAAMRQGLLDLLSQQLGQRVSPGAAPATREAEPPARRAEAAVAEATPLAQRVAPAPAPVAEPDVAEPAAQVEEPAPETTNKRRSPLGGLMKLSN